MHKEGRNPSLDLVRLFALSCVVAVHFFGNIEFYTQPVNCLSMYVMTCMRNALMVCVPLFIVLTGYLMGGKTPSRAYYRGIVKTLATYALASVAVLFYRSRMFGVAFTPGSIAIGILSFKAAPYAWYVEMYIGLFLLIPFVNVLYNGLATRGQKQALLATLLALTVLPSVMNIWRFDLSGWWRMPSVSADYVKLVPQWWEDLYPLTYYVVGRYLREYPLRLKKRTTALLIVVLSAASGLFVCYRMRGGAFASASFSEYASAHNAALTVLWFHLIASLPLSRLPEKGKRALALLSDCTLGAYLLSYICDQQFFIWLRAAQPDVHLRLLAFPLAVPVVLCGSLALSLALRMAIALPGAVLKRAALQSNRP